MIRTTYITALKCGATLNRFRSANDSVQMLVEKTLLKGTRQLGGGTKQSSRWVSSTVFFKTPEKAKSTTRKLDRVGGLFVFPRLLYAGDVDRCCNNVMRSGKGVMRLWIWHVTWLKDTCRWQNLVCWTLPNLSIFVPLWRKAPDY